MSKPTLRERYVYRSTNPSRRHRAQVSAFVVERFIDSAVVARIVPLGQVPARASEHELVLRALRHNLVVTGSWQPTPSRHHARARADVAVNRSA